MLYFKSWKKHQGDRTWKDDFYGDCFRCLQCREIVEVNALETDLPLVENADPADLMV